MAKIKKSRREVAAPVTVTANRLPLVSVIIPMYNSAKFIPQTLESLCYQTFKDFEVVVVDDYSTDNSVEVVESFAERLGGGLHVVKLRKNGGAGPARNIGINFARGKYIAFLDSDDLFTKTALEELTTLAEEFQADIVHFNNHFKLWDGEKKSVDAPEMTNFAELTNPKNFSIAGPPSPKVPTLETSDFASRIRSWVNRKYLFPTWTSFCRRDFLIANQIRFADMYTSEDHIFKFACLCFAEKFLMVPNIVYIVRPRDDSIMRGKNYNPQEYFRKRVNAFIKQFKVFDEFMSGIEFFRKHPDYHYAMHNWIFSKRIDSAFQFYTGTSPIYLNPIVEKEFRAAGADCAAAAAHLFDMANIQRLQIARLQYELNALKASK